MLAAEIKNGLPNGITYAEGLSLTALGWLNEHYSVKKQKREKQSTKLIPRHKNKLIDFIEVSLGSSDLTIETMAKETGLSPGHFSTQFKASFGVPPIDTSWKSV